MTGHAVQSGCARRAAIATGLAGSAASFAMIESVADRCGARARASHATDLTRRTARLTSAFATRGIRLATCAGATRLPGRAARDADVTRWIARGPVEGARIVGAARLSDCAALDTACLHVANAAAAAHATRATDPSDFAARGTDSIRARCGPGTTVSAARLPDAAAHRAGAIAPAAEPVTAHTAVATALTDVAARHAKARFVTDGSRCTRRRCRSVGCHRAARATRGADRATRDAGCFRSTDLTDGTRGAIAARRARRTASGIGHRLRSRGASDDGQQDQSDEHARSHAGLETATRAQVASQWVSRDVHLMRTGSGHRLRNAFHHCASCR